SQSFNSFQVMRNHIRACINYLLNQFLLTSEVRNQHLYAGFRVYSLNLLYAARPYFSSLAIQVIAVDRCDHTMLHIHDPNRFSNFFRFFQIRCKRAATFNSTELTPTGTNITQNHKSGSSPAPAITNVGAVTTCTYSMKAMLLYQILNLRIILAFWHLH